MARHPIVEAWLRGENDAGGCIAALEAALASPRVERVPVLEELIRWLDTKGAASVVCKWGDQPGETIRRLIENFRDGCPATCRVDDYPGCVVCMTPTPQTDALVKEFRGLSLRGFNIALVDLARRLESRASNERVPQNGGYLQGYKDGCAAASHAPVVPRSDYMDSAHYRVNKFVSMVRVMGLSDSEGRIYVLNGIPLTVDDLEAVVRESAPLFTGDAPKMDIQRLRAERLEVALKELMKRINLMAIYSNGAQVLADSDEMYDAKGALNDPLVPPESEPKENIRG